jgi:hypothetical protein
MSPMDSVSDADYVLDTVWSLLFSPAGVASDNQFPEVGAMFGVFVPLEDPALLLNDSPNIGTSGQATGAVLTAPAGKTTANDVAGRAQDDENPADPVNFTNNSYSEFEYCFLGTSVAVNGDVYEFRMTDVEALLDTYTVTPQLTIQNQINQSLSGTLNFSGTTTKRTSHPLAGALSFVGAQTRRTGKGLSGALSFIGAQTRRTGKALTAALSFVGAQVRSISHLQTAALNFSGSVTKQTRTARTATLNFVGSLGATKLFLKALTATMNFSGSLAGRANKSLSGALSFIGAQTKNTATTKTATLGLAGNVTKKTSRSFTAALNFAGSVAAIKLFLKSFTATLSFSGSVKKQTGKPLAGSLNFAGTVVKQCRKGLSAALSFVGGLVTQLSHSGGGQLFLVSFSATLSFVGDLIPPSSTLRTYIVALQNRILAIQKQARELIVNSENRKDDV